MADPRRSRSYDLSVKSSGYATQLRPPSAAEQHLHSFLEVLPFATLAFTGCLLPELTLGEPGGDIAELATRDAMVAWIHRRRENGAAPFAQIALRVRNEIGR